VARLVLGWNVQAQTRKLIGLGYRVARLVLGWNGSMSGSEVPGYLMLTFLVFLVWDYIGAS
jgi:hypothetical protein